MKNKLIRRQYLIDPSQQIRFIFRFCGIVLLSSLIIGGIVFLYSINSTTVAIENTRVSVKPTADFILPVLTFTVILVSFCSAFVMMLLSLLYTHKISGPVFRMKREVDLMKEGQMARNFSIRGDDQLQGLSQSLTELGENFNRQHVELKGQFKYLAHYLEEKEFVLGADDREKIVSMLEEIHRTLNYFKV